MKYRFGDTWTEVKLQDGQNLKYNAPHPPMALEGWVMEFEQAHDINEILSDEYAKDHP